MSNTETNNLIKFPKRKLIEIILSQIGIIKELQTQVGALQTEVGILKKDSSNSSKPPSSDMNNVPKRNQSLRQKSDKKSGGQNGHKGITRGQSDHPDKIISCRPFKCAHCGKDLSDQEGKVIARKQEIDVPPIKPEITEYQQEEIKCICGHCNKGEFPEHIKSPMQIGQNLKSFIVYLNASHYLPYKRLTQLVKDLLNFPLSEGTIENALNHFEKKANPFYSQILEDIKKGSWTGGDETGSKVDKKKWWQWVWQNTTGSFYVIENSRGYKVVEKYFGTDYAGTLIHDCWSAQNNTIAGAHQLCHPHLLRDLIFCMEIEKSGWAHKAKQFLLKSEKARDTIWKEDFSLELREKIIQDYQDKLDGLIKESVIGAESKRLQKRFRNHREKILCFMNGPDIPWHNNSSERAIRNSKLHQKISGCFRSVKGAKRRSVTLSIIETCKKRNLNILNSLQQIFQGSFSW